MMEDSVGVDSADILKDLAQHTDNDSADILKDLAEFSVLVASREKPGSESSCGTTSTAASYVSSECDFFFTDRKKYQAPISCKMATMESVELSVSDFHKMHTSDTSRDTNQTAMTDNPRNKVAKPFWFQFGSMKAT
jgi:hypothetical protein